MFTYFYNIFPKIMNGMFYSVQPGDTLESIAKNFDTTIDNLIIGNNLINPYKIEEGDILFLAGIQEMPFRNNQELILNNEKKFDNNNDTYIENIIDKRFPNLKKGDKDKYVFTFKMMMSALGYKAKKMDSLFDKELEKNLKDFQKKSNLRVTGQISNKDWSYIFYKINNKNKDVF